MTHPCPVGCGRTTKTGHLTCGPCWHQVPKELQTAVYQTWRRWRRDFGNAELMLAYREAADAAVGSVP